jgi:hypothetical protein
VKISASKEGVKFQVAGDMGTGNIVCKANNSVDDEDDAVRQRALLNKQHVTIEEYLTALGNRQTKRGHNRLAIMHLTAWGYHNTAYIFTGIGAL